MYILLGILILLFLLLCYFLKPQKPQNKQLIPFYHRNFAHRGLHTKDKKIPENSIPAFKAAVEHDYGIELDVQFTKDKKVVVFHDDTLDRVCHVHGRVDEYTYQELQAYHLQKTKEKIPLFQDVLGVVQGKVPLIVELKTGHDNTKLCEEVYHILKDYSGDYCIESFDPFIVQWFRKNAPTIFRGQLSANPRKLIEENLAPKKAFMLGNVFSNVVARPNFIAYDKNHMPFPVKLAYALGATRFVWTVRDTDSIKAIQAKNDGVIFEYYTPTSRYD